MLPNLLRDAGDPTKASAMRVALLIWVLGVFVAWAIASVYAKSLQTIPESVITILGLLTGGKAIQRFGEKK